MPQESAQEALQEDLRLVRAAIVAVDAAAVAAVAAALAGTVTSAVAATKATAAAPVAATGTCAIAATLAITFSWDGRAHAESRRRRQ